jgi:hypothetical protein
VVHPLQKSNLNRGDIRGSIANPTTLHQFDAVASHLNFPNRLEPLSYRICLRVLPRLYGRKERGCFDYSFRLLWGTSSTRVPAIPRKCDNSRIRRVGSYSDDGPRYTQSWPIDNPAFSERYWLHHREVLERTPRSRVR